MFWLEFIFRYSAPCIVSNIAVATNISQRCRFLKWIVRAIFYKYSAALPLLILPFFQGIFT